MYFYRYNRLVLKSELIWKGDFMIKIKRNAPLMFIALLAFSCVGTSGTKFERIKEDTISLGLSTYDDIVHQMGEPLKEKVIIKNRTKFKLIQYVYASTGGKARLKRVVPSRAQLFYFYEGILVGHAFTSSWTEDHTDFDETKIEQILKGESTKEDVINLLGKPCGKFVYPYAKNKGDEILLYHYQEGRRYAYSIEFYDKSLNVECDQMGIVIEYEYLESGKK
jgi:hypothetical protein